MKYPCQDGNIINAEGISEVTKLEYTFKNDTLFKVNRRFQSVRLCGISFRVSGA